VSATQEIIGAVRTSLRRDLQTFARTKVNNFFLFIALLIYGPVLYHLEPRAAEPVVALLAALVLVAIGGDPLAKVPQTRLTLWPLSAKDRAILRLKAIALAPAVWIATLGLILFRTHRPDLGILAILLAIAAPAIRIKPRATPRFPLPFPALFRANLRQIAATLDFWLAAIIAVGGTIYRVATPRVDPDAVGMLSLVVALALSSYAQCLYGLDAAGTAMTRYRLLPIPAWRVTLEKDAAYLAVLAVLTAGLNPLPALAFGVTAVTIGNFAPKLPLKRHRFAGTTLRMALLQAIPSLAVGVAVMRW